MVGGTSGGGTRHAPRCSRRNFWLWVPAKGKKAKAFKPPVAVNERMAWAADKIGVAADVLPARLVDKLFEFPTAGNSLQLLLIRIERPATARACMTATADGLTRTHLSPRAACRSTCSDFR